MNAGPDGLAVAGEHQTVAEPSTRLDQIGNRNRQLRPQAADVLVDDVGDPGTPTGLLQGQPVYPCTRMEKFYHFDA